MAWTETTRAQYVRGGMRYASDCTDAEWAFANSDASRPGDSDWLCRKLSVTETWSMIAGKGPSGTAR
jgi:hypothetical protein